MVGGSSVKAGVSRTVVDEIYATVTGHRRNAKIEFGQWIEALQMINENIPGMEKTGIKGFLREGLLPKVQKDEFQGFEEEVHPRTGKVAATTASDRRQVFQQACASMVEAHLNGLEQDFQRSLLEESKNKKPSGAGTAKLARTEAATSHIPGILTVEDTYAASTFADAKPRCRFFFPLLHVKPRPQDPWPNAMPWIKEPREAPRLN